MGGEGDLYLGKKKVSQEVTCIGRTSGAGGQRCGPGRTPQANTFVFPLCIWNLSYYSVDY